MIFDYALAILLAIGLVFAGLVVLTWIYLAFAEWHYIYKKWQVRRNGQTN